MKKQIIKEKIFAKRIGNSDGAIVRFSDLPDNLISTDIIDISREEGFYSENNSYDSSTTLHVYREREETDEEYNKRMEMYSKLMENSKKNRYETYLKLKEEFEKL